jgi:adenylate cyclase
MAEQRKLVTIMALDVAGYSRASEKDDSAMAAAVGRLRTVIADAIAPHGGRVFNTAGDGFMVEFSSAISAVAAAQALLVAIAEEGLPAMRIGLHLGDVILAKNDDLLGHGVNVAARLMALARPGTAVLSAPVQMQLNEAARFTLRPLGRVQLDKMGTRIDAFAIAPKHVRFTRVRWKRARRWVFAAAGLALVAVIALACWLAFAPRAITIPRLAVLRFQGLGDTEPYFAEGVADELITELSRVVGMEVTARASSFALSGDNATPEKASKKLRATLVLTASVRRLPNAIRVNAQLVEAPGGRSLWSEVFERPTNEAFALQRDIAVRVAQQADARITAPPPKSVDAEAYRLYLQGRDLQLGMATFDWAKVRDLYRNAVQRDPNFGEAWAALADAEASTASEAIDAGPADGFLTDAAMAPALAAADRALALDNGAAYPFLTRAMIYTWLGHWPLAAEAAGETEKRGGQASVFYRALGYMRKAEDARRQSTSLNPLYATEWNNYAYTCEYNGDTASQLDAAQRAHDLAPNNASATRGLVRALIANHRTDEAWTLMKQAGWVGESDFTSRQLAWMAGHGDAVPAAEILDAVKAGKEYLDAAIGLLADAKRWDGAAALLDRWGPPSRNRLFSLMRQQWAPLRKTPQFWALMQREGLVKYWHDSGQWPDFCRSESVCQKYR